jgi:hypothetical protein
MNVNIDTRKPCKCGCGKFVSRSTEYRHRKDKVKAQANFAAEVMEKDAYAWLFNESASTLVHPPSESCKRPLELEAVSSAHHDPPTSSRQRKRRATHSQVVDTQADTNLNSSGPSHHSLDDTHAALRVCGPDVDRDSVAADGAGMEYANDGDNLLQDEESDIDPRSGIISIHDFDPRSDIISIQDLMAENLIVEAEKLCEFIALPVVQHSSPNFYQVRADIPSSRTMSTIYTRLK